MLSSISSPLKSKMDVFRLLGERETQIQARIETPLFEKISESVSVLHHRNAQLRSAILSKSEEKVTRRRLQFSAVLRSCVRLIVEDLYGPIARSHCFVGAGEYTNIRKETLSFYKDFVQLSNRTSKEMLEMGADFARELFQFELLMKEYQETEQQSIYPLFKEVSSVA